MKTLPRSSTIPGVELPAKDPFSNDSVNGTFSTSLKGIRQALRKKGRRTEVVVQRVEDEIRGWLGGKGVLEAEAAAADSDNEDGSCGRWKVVDETLIESSFRTKDQVEGDGDNGLVAGSRRMPARHRLRGDLPPLPITDGTLPAILELSRSVGHLTWLAVEGFERMVIHLVCRYYELVSWSELVLPFLGTKLTCRRGPHDEYGRASSSDPYYPTCNRQTSSHSYRHHVHS
jgi:hypothetical protein